MKHIFRFLFLALFSSKIFAIDFACPDPQQLTSVEKLDIAYRNAEIVFLANVELELIDGTPNIKWRYSVISPVLKGEIKDEGYLFPSSKACETPDVSEEAVFLVFLNSHNDTLKPENTLMVVYNRGQAHEKWALDWVARKAHN
ncbi:hypothetical protein [Microbulbifer rhizosphaerae]|uniref:Uncharacterized protein n=1 Tax=Microbulbifer rhizosphaerae TaxID=1562603 RepID=A0A7W4WH90_9GAMM|nr:hypothetical protein [Microbulbifer rhizosphaerae]MBB3063727.1 hypothetical protein [Microbulbifer rhizosphaerae]